MQLIVAAFWLVLYPMKNVFYSLILLLTLTLTNSCNTDFNVTADYKEVMVIYALLDAKEPVQYIRIQKGFLNESGSALDFAKDPDSLYYPVEQLKVELIAQNSGSTFLLAADTLPKDTGDFASTPNYIYTFNQPLDETENYQLRVENLSTGKVVTASTPLVKDFQTIKPPNEVSNDYTINLVGKNVNGSNRSVDVEWYSAENGKIYQMVMRFHYVEFMDSVSGTGDTTYIDWLVFKNYETSTLGGQPEIYKFEGQNFYPYLANKLDADPRIIRKVLDKPIEFIFTVGGEEVYNYIQVNTQGQTGITALEALPDYTNIDGGLGIISTRTIKSRPQILLRDASLDSLKCGSYTADLNFITNSGSCN